MAHLLMLHGHPVGYLPPTMASEILYDSNNTVKNKIDQIQSGNISVSLSGSSEQIEKSINFAVPYSSVPIVVASISDTGRGQSGSYPRTAVGVSGITKTGATFRIKTDAVMTGNIVLYWIAVPKTQ